MLQSDGQNEILPERRLQLQLHVLSKSISCSLVERLCIQLLSSRTMTEYESQVIRSKETDMQKASQLLQVVLKKGRNACLLFYKDLERCCPELFERVTGLQAVKTQHNSEMSEKRNHCPATYVINISHSTLSNFIIGGGSFQHVTTCTQQPLTQDSVALPQETMEAKYESDHQRAVQACTDPKFQSVQVYRSKLQYVIIGDSNTMEVRDTVEVEEEEEEEEEVEVVEEEEEEEEDPMESN
ncbi:uncharacterized protein si:dkey-29h14.10 [Esox lucius]|uniref:uncharacterized protein si:dkey-29h14.10 n=1 Tax=Esox lucius TaxID=8010 RepID=UPI0009732DD9|nr:uncharacterized protein si:dkey-29h14.10 [Esox lucius]